MSKSHKSSLLALINNIVPLDFKNNTLMCNFDYTADSINGIKPFGIHIDNTTVAYYDFQPYPDSSKLYDKSPGCNHGIINGCTLTGGINGYAYNFDGIDDYINIGNSSNFDFIGPFSISMYLKTSTIDTNYRTIISKCGGTVSDTPFCIDIKNGKLRFFANTSGGTYGIADETSYTSIADNNWHHIACIYDGTNWAIYVDGSQYASVSQPATIATNNSNVLIGYILNVNGYFQGKIAKLAIYNRALTQEEIFRHSKESIYQLTGMDQVIEYMPIRYIRNWLNGNTLNADNHWIEIQAIDTAGNNIALNKLAYVEGSPSSLCPNLVDGITDTAQWTLQNMSNSAGIYARVVDLGQVYNTIQQITVWHYYGDGRKYHRNIIEVSEDGKTWHKLFNSDVHGEYSETSSGFTVNVPIILKRKGKFGGALVIGEATTNLITNIDGRPKTISAGGNTPPSVNLVNMKTPFGNSAWQITIPSSNQTGYSGCRAITNNSVTTMYCDGRSYSYYTYVYGNINGKVIIYPTGAFGMSQCSREPLRDIGDWKCYKYDNYSSTAGYSGTNYMTFYANTVLTQPLTFYVAAVQLEEKSYPTNFTEYSRLDSSIYLPIEVLNKDEGTISFWIKYNRIPSAVLPIISNNDSESGYAFDILFGLNGGNQTFYFRKYKGSGNSNQASYTVTNTVLNRWAHVAATWKNSDVLKLYIDGQLVSTSSSGVDMSVLGNVLVIGHSPGLGRSAPNFMMDELRIDTIRRTDDEILQWYATQYPFYYDNPIKIVAQ
ncbi:MAG: LamG domain-containing protein [bacterium]|nr:LamG domain-containing protein [bacterium]